MSIFNSDAFDDDDNIDIQDEISVSLNIFKGELKNIADIFINNSYDDLYRPRITYNIIDNKIILYDKNIGTSMYIDKTYTLFDGTIIPYNVLLLDCVIAFNSSFSKISFIEVLLYDNNYSIITDNDYNLIKFLNIIFNKYGITADKIVYNTYKQYLKYSLEINSERRFDKNTNKTILSSDFCKYIPSIVNKDDLTISKKIFINKYAFEDEHALLLFCKTILEKNKCKLYLSQATTFINGYGLYTDPSNFQESFYKTLSSAPQYYDVDDYFILNKTYLKKFKIS